MSDDMKTKDELYWRDKLTPEQYHVLREKGTEPPFSGKLLYNEADGTYKCAACGAKIFSNQAKYESTQLGLEGWPSFADADSAAIQLVPDDSWGMHRTEVVCANCGGHLGHLFDDPSSPTGKHYCINSCALNFDKAKSGKN